MSDSRRVGLILGLLAVALPGRAGDYHTGANSHCYDCHSDHDSQTHGYRGGPVRGRPDPVTRSGEDWLSAGAPASYLLKASGSELCLACHDGMTLAPDVVGENSNNYVRQAGAIVPLGSPGPSALVSAPDGEAWAGHRLGVESVPAGGTERMTLTCSSCHDPHGNDAYRSLRVPFSGRASDGLSSRPDFRSLPKRRDLTPVVSVAVGMNDLSKDVFLRSVVSGNLVERYGVQNVIFNEPKSGESAMDAFCRGCHTTIHDPSVDTGALAGDPAASQWAHPTAGAARRQRNFDRQPVGGTWSLGEPLSRPSGQGSGWGRLSPRPAHLSVTCLTCHKAHGNRNRHALILRSGRGLPSEEGDTAGVIEGQQALCGQCHEAAVRSSGLRSDR